MNNTNAIEPSRPYTAGDYALVARIAALSAEGKRVLTDTLKKLKTESEAEV
ncbi:MAG: hypothetical protein FWG31_07230 [Oscillospiraceae bacterium]|nr:hypothetical protein [Oscillospiraceae bacterium]